MRKALSIILILLFLVGTASAATINVPAKYKTIQGAVNAAKTGDTVKVAYGTYKENVIIPKNKRLYLTGTNYPKVNGFILRAGGTGTIYGFSIQKYGIEDSYSGGKNTFRNNKLYNCNIDIAGGLSSEDVIMNNLISGGSILLYDTRDHLITGNTITGKVGLDLGEGVTVKGVSKNTFKNCGIGVRTHGQLEKFTGNKYSGNKVNIKVVKY